MTVSPVDFDYVRTLVRDRSAIVLGDDKEYLVKARLTPLARQDGRESISELVAQARAGKPGVADLIVGAMATKETSFFRDLHPFNTLRDTIIPELLSKGSRSLRFWSGAASTGQEAYSLAILMSENFASAPDPTILATDFAVDAIEKGQSGTYTPLEVNRGLTARQLVKYFDRDGLNWVVEERMRRAVEFRQLNLIEPWSIVQSMDVVLMRNVLIYFDVDSRQVVLDRVARVLRPGGYLILGSSESTYGLRTSFQQVTVGRTTCYRMPDMEV